MVSLIVGNPSGSGVRKTTFCLTAAIWLRECGNESLIRLESMDINTSVVGKDKGRSSAVIEIEPGLAEVVWSSVCPSKNPSLRRSRPRRLIPN